MNREDIIRMAREAGLVGLEQGGVLENFERFAALAAEWGAKQEREACLKLATEAGRNKAGVAAAIRARGEVQP